LWLTNRAILEGKLFSGLICLESATFVLKLSNYPPNPLIMYTTYAGKIHNQITYLIHVPKINMEDTYLVKNNLYVTNRERTICELIEYEANEEYIYQSIESYTNRYNLDDLFAYASNRGLLSEVKKYIDTLSDYY